MLQDKEKRLLRRALYLFIDLVIANLAIFIALIIRVMDSPLRENSDPLGVYAVSYLIGVPILSVIMYVTFKLFGVYRIMWKYARSSDVVELSLCTFISYALYTSIHFAISEICVVGNPDVTVRLPWSVYLFGSVAGFFVMLGERFIIRLLANKYVKGKSSKNDRIMVVGAGSAGNILLRDLNVNKAFRNSQAVCIIDDDPQKLGMNTCGVRIVGGRDTIEFNVKKYNVNKIIFAIPNTSAKERADILSICMKTGCSVSTLPSLDQMLNVDNISMSSLRKIKVEDLLGREPIKVDIESITGYIKGKTVLVTGGGGSIGSELCRQIAKREPKCLVIFDIYENNAYNIQNELISEHKDLHIETLIGSVRDEKRLNEVFERFKPDIVYHAAAHKHVPLMEVSPKEAIKNNVFGTLNTVKTADKYGVKRFVMISTDKAVNPTNVMGATKRICEMIVQTYSRRSKTEFIAVRFGNVLGSNGSVIPLFEKQIAEGGPVTVTDKRIVRYFMTIPEAVSLVLQAGAFGKGGEIFVFDMGKPMKIVELAENMIRLSGYVPYEDINIEFIGLRPGEKLYEELLMKEEGLRKTENKLIYIGKPIDINEEDLFAGLERLKTVLTEDGDVRDAIKSIVTTYNPQKC